MKETNITYGTIPVLESNENYGSAPIIQTMEIMEQPLKWWKKKNCIKNRIKPLISHIIIQQKKN